MCECVPAIRTRNGKKKGQYASPGYGITLARKELEKRDGPCPPDKDLCRHLCENDSGAPNGFVCTLHTVWGTYSENSMDKPEEVRKKFGKEVSKLGGKVAGRKAVESGQIQKICATGGKASSSIERTCEHCGKTMKGPVYFRYHGDNCKLASPPSITSTE